MGERKATVLRRGGSHFHKVKSEKEGESGSERNIGFPQYTAVRESSGLHRERLLPLLKYIWKRVFASPRTKGPLEVIEQLFRSRGQAPVEGR